MSHQQSFDAFVFRGDLFEENTVYVGINCLMLKQYTPKSFPETNWKVSLRKKYSAT